MKLTLLLVAAIALVSLAGSEEISKEVPVFVRTLRDLQREPPISGGDQTRAVVNTEWITQKLDNFDEAETRTWEMRYMVNDEYFKPGGPMFIYVGGEWSITPGSISNGHFVDMAKEHNAILFYTEHRYYGESKPTSDITVDNLKYQHVKQALADLAHFIEYKRETEADLATSKVIMAGGSYSATMVVWFKRLYPELLAGGWASSAPILAKVDFREYKEVVGQAIRELGSQQCYDRIQNGIAELEHMFDNKRGAEVKAMMKICNNFDDQNDLDKWSLFGSISNIFAGIVQYQREGDVPFYCNYLMSFEDDLSAITNFALWAFGGDSCNDLSYKSSLAYYLDSTYKYGASRPWFYQTCNEYGWYQSSASRNQPFGTKFPAALYTTLCADIFGDAAYTNENINAKATETNVVFGGMTPEVENVYMTHGGLDPWNPMGHGAEQGATVIARASHCADFGSAIEADSAEMSDSKKRIAELVRLWLGDDESKADKARKFIRKLVH